MSIQCDQCQFTMANNEDLAEHRAARHPPKEPEPAPEPPYEMIERLRGTGIKRITFAQFPVYAPHEIEFFDHRQIANADNIPDFPKGMGLDEPDKCKCGHDDTEHAGDGFCLRGCNAESCLERTSPDSAQSQ